MAAKMALLTLTTEYADLGDADLVIAADLLYDEDLAKLVAALPAGRRRRPVLCADSAP